VLVGNGWLFSGFGRLTLENNPTGLIQNEGDCVFPFLARAF